MSDSRWCSSRLRLWALLRSLATTASVEVDFVESELYRAVDALGAGRFDLVHTGIGALCWLPGVRRWAEVVPALLRPGGRLFTREGHPVLWALDDPRADGLLVLATGTSRAFRSASR